MNVVIIADILKLIYNTKGGGTLTILHLKYACETARVGSLNKAAANLFISQPSLSRAIKELEAELGTTIFDRTHKGMVLTPEGEMFLEYAERILSQIDDLESMYKNNAAVTQKFAVCAPRSAYISEAFSKFICSAAKCNEGVTQPAHGAHSVPEKMYFRETSTLSAIKYILDSEYSIGIIRCEQATDKYVKEFLDSRNLEWKTIAEFRSVLLISSKSSIADVDDAQITEQMLSDYAQLALGDDIEPQSSSAPGIHAPITVSTAENVKRRIYIYDRASAPGILSNAKTYTLSEPLPEDMLDTLELVQKDVPNLCCGFRDFLIHKKDYRLSNLDKMFITELARAKRKHFKASSFNGQNFFIEY